MNKITNKMLNGRITYLNRLLGRKEAYITNGTYNVGTFYLNPDGYGLFRVRNSQGGVERLVFASTKAEFYAKLNAFIDGVEFMLAEKGE